MRDLIKYLEFSFSKKIKGYKRKVIMAYIRDNEILRDTLQEHYDDFTKNGTKTFEQAVEESNQRVEKAKKEFMDMINGKPKRVSDNETML